MNGTTADIAVIRCSKVYAMNIGDSRMFYAYQNEEKKMQAENREKSTNIQNYIVFKGDREKFYP